MLSNFAFLLLHFEVVLVFDLLNLALDLHLEELRGLVNVLAVVRLQVLEEGRRAD